MPHYYYKAHDKSGMLMRGHAESETRENLISNLEKIGYYVTSISAGGGVFNFPREFLQKFRPITWFEMVTFTRHLATMLRSGFPLLQALIGIAKQTDNRKMRLVVEGLVSEVQLGSSFSAAVEKYPDVFSGMFISMVRAGEASGTLTEILQRLALLAKSEAETRTKIRSATTYPLVVVIVAISAVTFIIIKVLPKFTAIFESSGAKLPVPTVILLSISHFIQAYWYVPLVVITAGIFIVRNWTKTKSGRYKFDFFRLKIPIFGDLMLKISISRFTRILGVLVQSGVPLLQSLGIVENVVGNQAVAEVVQNARGSVTEGGSLAEPFRLTGIFPEMVVRMINAGEETGRLDEMLGDIADFYDSEVEYTIRNLTALLEPVMVIVMGAIVGFIALSVLLPIFNIVRIIRR